MDMDFVDELFADIVEYMEHNGFKYSSTQLYRKPAKRARIYTYGEHSYFKVDEDVFIDRYGDDLVSNDYYALADVCETYYYVNAAGIEVIMEKYYKMTKAGKFVPRYMVTMRCPDTEYGTLVGLENSVDPDIVISLFVDLNRFKEFISEYSNSTEQWKARYNILDRQEEIQSVDV